MRSSTAPLWGGLFTLLALGGRQEVDLGCHPRGAYLLFPAVLEATYTSPCCSSGPEKCLRTLSHSFVTGKFEIPAPRRGT